MKELLFSITKKDFKFETFRSGGKGGQHQNKTESGVRITHIESGAVGESRSERSQHANKRLAFNHLVKSKKFQMWHKFKTALVLQGIRDTEKWVEDQMKEENLKIEFL